MCSFQNIQNHTVKNKTNAPLTETLIYMFYQTKKVEIEIVIEFF